MSNSASALTIERTAKGPMVATTNGVGLATDLFGQPVRLDESYFKTPLGPLCSQGCLADHHTKRIVSQRCKLRTCPYCRKLLAWRIAEQVCYQSIGTYDKIEVSQWGAYQRRLGRSKIPYKTFPQEECLVVVSEAGRRFLPDNEQALIELIDGWVAGVPKGKRVSGSRGFGGRDWSGCRQKGDRSRYQYLGRDIEVILAQERAYVKEQLNSLALAADGSCTFTKESFKRIIERETKAKVSN